MESRIENIREINVYLPDEATDTWRSVQAEDLGNGLFRLLPSSHYDPTKERWEFPPESIVRGEMKELWVTAKVAGKYTNVMQSALVAIKP